MTVGLAIMKASELCCGNFFFLSNFLNAKIVSFVTVQILVCDSLSHIQFMLMLWPANREINAILMPV